MKTVKISNSLFEVLCYFFENLEFRAILMDLYTPDYCDLYDAIGAELRKKHDAVVKREMFARYKSAADPVEREEARKSYLSAADIPEGFRSAAEIHEEFL